MMACFCRDCLSDDPLPASASGTALCPQCGSPRLLAHAELYDLTLAHIDCDAFFAAVEKRDNPDLLSQPVIIGQGRRGVVSTCCYIARSFGIRSAMPVFQARKLCPNGVFMTGNMQKYKTASRQIRDIFNQMSPAIEPLSIDEAFIDLAGTEKLHHSPPAKTLARYIKIIEQEVGITLSVGLSYNKFLAKLASDMDKPRGFFIIGRAQAKSILAPLPISRMAGVGKSLEQKMRRQGICQIGQLQQMDKSQLIGHYGSMGARLYAFSRGEDTRPLSTMHPIKSVSHEITLSHDLADYAVLKKKLWELCEKLSDRLKEKELAGRVVTLKLKTAGFRQISRSVTLDMPTRMAEVLFEVGQHMLKAECHGQHYRLIGIGVSDLGSPAQADLPDLIDTKRKKKLEMETLMDRVRQKHGKRSLIKGRSLK